MFSDYINDIKNSLKEVKENLQQIQLEALNEAKAALLKRAFNTNGATSVNGESVGGYVDTYYLRKRLNAGKFNLIKNFFFDGNLFNSIQVGKLDNKTVLGFNDEKQALIAEGNEEYVGLIIFQLSDLEQEVMENYAINKLDGL